MLYVVNDLHGAKKLIDQTLDSMSHLQPGDQLVINGDGAGARGPVMNQIVKIFYEVRRGETDVSALLDVLEEVIGERPEIPREWIYDTVHAGLFRKLMADRYEKFAICMRDEIKSVLEETLRPLSDMARRCDVEIIYVAGNGEITPDDFATDDITTEENVAPAERYYQKLAKKGYFKRMGIKYVPYAKRMPGGVVLLSTNLLDMPKEDILATLDSHRILGMTVSKIIVHYPPAIAPIGSMFDFWTPNKMDIQRSDTLGWIIENLHLEEDADIYFGHIHLGANDERMSRYPTSATFRMGSFRNLIWVKPGSVVKI